MDHKLSVLVQIDLNGAYVRLLVTGCLTRANQHALYPLVARARGLMPPVTVSIDLTAAEHIEATAVELLRRAVDHDSTVDGAGPVELLVPAAAADHLPAPTRMTRRARAPKWMAA